MTKRYNARAEFDWDADEEDEEAGEVFDQLNRRRRRSLRERAAETRSQLETHSKMIVFLTDGR